MHEKQNRFDVSGLRASIESAYKVDWTKPQTDVLVELYNDQLVVVDHLPYTGEFEQIYYLLRSITGMPVSRHHTFGRLIDLRKEGGILEKKGRKHGGVPSFWV